MKKDSVIHLNAGGLEEIHGMLFDLIYSKHGIEKEGISEIAPKFLVLRLLRETGFQDPPPRYLGSTDSNYKYGKPQPKSLPEDFDRFDKDVLIGFLDAIINDRIREDGYIDRDPASGGSSTKGNTAFKFFDRGIIEKAFIWMQESLDRKGLTPTLPSSTPKVSKKDTAKERMIQERHQALCEGLGIKYDTYKEIPLGDLLEEILKQGKVVISRAPLHSRNPFLYDIDGNMLYAKEDAGKRPTETLEKIVSKGFKKDKIKKIINDDYDFNHRPFPDDYKKLGKVIKDSYKFTEQMFSPEFLEKWGITVGASEVAATSPAPLPKPTPAAQKKPETVTLEVASVEILLANGFYINPSINPRFAKERSLLESRISPHFAKSHFTADEAKQVSVKYVQKNQDGRHYAVAILEAPTELHAKLESFNERYYSGKDIFTGRS